MSKKVTDTVQEMAQPIVDSLQLELVDIEFVKEVLKLVPSRVY